MDPQDIEKEHAKGHLLKQHIVYICSSWMLKTSDIGYPDMADFRYPDIGYPLSGYLRISGYYPADISGYPDTSGLVESAFYEYS